MSQTSETAGSLAESTGARVLEALSSAAISMGAKRGVRWRREEHSRTQVPDEYAVSMGFVGAHLRGELSVALSESALSVLSPGRPPAMGTVELAEGLARVLRDCLEVADEPVRLSVPLAVGGVAGLVVRDRDGHLHLADGDLRLECRLRIERSED